jgi:hypothetical protein
MYKHAKDSEAKTDGRDYRKSETGVHKRNSDWKKYRNITPDGRTKRISAGARKVRAMTLKGRRKQYAEMVCTGMPDMVSFFGPEMRSAQRFAPDRDSTPSLRPNPWRANVYVTGGSGDYGFFWVLVGYIVFCNVFAKNFFTSSSTIMSQASSTPNETGESSSGLRRVLTECLLAAARLDRVQREREAERLRREQEEAEEIARLEAEAKEEERLQREWQEAEEQRLADETLSRALEENTNPHSTSKRQ